MMLAARRDSSPPPQRSMLMRVGYVGDAITLTLNTAALAFSRHYRLFARYC